MTRRELVIRGRRFPVRRVGLLVAALVALLVVGQAIVLANAVTPLMADYAEIQVLLALPPAELIRPEGIARAEAVILRSEADLKALRTRAGPLPAVAPLLSWLPRYGGDVAQAPALLDLAIETAAAGHAALDLYHGTVEGLLADAQAGHSPTDTRFAFQALQAVRVHKGELEIQLHRAQGSRLRVDAARLSERPAALLGRLDRVLDTALPIVQACDILPDLLGMRETRHYLLLAQNSDERRATGGYISGVGMIEVDQGRLKADFRDSYAVDNLAKPHAAPPQALAEYMWAGIWVLRDANWSPDFPTSAQKAAEIYESDQGVHVDGVIAVNLVTLQRLVGALGPLDLAAYGERVDASNVLDKIETYFVSPEGQGQTGDWWAHRKDLAGALLAAMVARVGSGAFDAPRLGQAVWSSLAAKDVLIYLERPKETQVVRDLGWDGALPPVHGDALILVDSNVGFNKVDPRVERRVEYRVELATGGRSSATVRVQYRNTNPASSLECEHAPKYKATYAAMRDDCYWDYLRIYVPRAMIPISATQAISPTYELSEPGYTTLGGYLVLPRGETRTVQFDYWILTRNVRSDREGEYRLDWIAQPGATTTLARVMVTIPDSLSVSSVAPAPDARSGSTLEFALSGARDTTIRIGMVPPALPLLNALPGILVFGVVLGGTYGAVRWRKARPRPRGDTASPSRDEDGAAKSIS